MADFKVDDCHSCGAKVIWAITTKARSMPVDAEPVKGWGGNVQLEERPGFAPLARVLNVTQQVGATDLRKSHFVTCPQAAKWRHKPAGRRP